MECKWRKPTVLRGPGVGKQRRDLGGRGGKARAQTASPPLSPVQPPGPTDVPAWRTPQQAQ
eukprot:12287402-Alexandrium_andersonii.AAC.1